MFLLSFCWFFIARLDGLMFLSKFRWELLALLCEVFALYAARWKSRAVDLVSAFSVLYAGNCIAGLRKLTALTELRLRLTK